MKLAIYIKGLGRKRVPPRIGRFAQSPDYHLPIWGGKLLDAEEFNEVVDQALSFRNGPAGFTVGIRAVTEQPKSEDLEPIGSRLLGESYNGVKITKELIEKVILDFNTDTFSWNRFKDQDRKNVLVRYIDANSTNQDDENDSEDPSTETDSSEDESEEDSEEQNGVPVNMKHRGRGKYEITNAAGEVLETGLTKEEAEAKIN